MKINILMIALVAALLTISFLIGAAWGAERAVREVIGAGEQFLNIQLSDRAVDVLVSNPRLFHFIINASMNYTNPFDHPQAAVQFEYCMITINKYDLCYDNQVRKYGKSIIKS